jgi:hypothetical protein
MNSKFSDIPTYPFQHFVIRNFELRHRIATPLQQTTQQLG